MRHRVTSGERGASQIAVLVFLVLGIADLAWINLFIGLDADNVDQPAKFEQIHAVAEPNTEGTDDPTANAIGDNTVANTNDLAANADAVGTVTGANDSVANIDTDATVATTDTVATADDSAANADTNAKDTVANTNDPTVSNNTDQTDIKTKTPTAVDTTAKSTIDKVATNDAAKPDALDIGAMRTSIAGFRRGFHASPRIHSQIQSVVKRLRKSPNLAITLRGHTDSTGSAETNRRLGLARARFVRKALRRAGISTERIAIESVGAAELIGDRTATENRRVEIVWRKN